MAEENRVGVSTSEANGALSELKELPAQIKLMIMMLHFYE